MLQRIWFLMMAGGFVTFFVIFGYYVITKTPVEPWVLSAAIIVTGVGFVLHERMNFLEFVLATAGIMLMLAPVSFISLSDFRPESVQIVFLAPIIGCLIFLIGWYLNVRRLTPEKNQDIT